MARKIKVDNALSKKFASQEKKRSIGTKSKQVFILIVTEGTKTEPNYFEAIRAKFPRGLIDTVDIQGTARSRSEGKKRSRKKGNRINFRTR